MLNRFVHVKNTRSNAQRQQAASQDDSLRSTRFSTLDKGSKFDNAT